MSVRESTYQLGLSAVSSNRRAGRICEIGSEVTHCQGPHWQGRSQNAVTTDSREEITDFIIVLTTFTVSSQSLQKETFTFAYLDASNNPV